MYMYFRYAAPVMWNSLPDDFRNGSNFNYFKGLILSWNGKNCNFIACNSNEIPYHGCIFVCFGFIVCFSLLILASVCFSFILVLL